MPYDLNKIRIACAEEVGWTSIDNTRGYYEGMNPFGMWMEVPPFPTCANAAITLIDFLAKPENGGWICETRSLWKVVSKCHWHIVSFWKSADPEHVDAANTFPLAVCLAFLRARGRDLKEVEV